jgi:type II secretory pathway component PulF
MPTFQYQAMNGDAADAGADDVEARDRGSALRLLRARGVTPTRLDEVKQWRRPLAGEGAATAPDRAAASRTPHAASRSATSTLQSRASSLIRPRAMSRSEFAAFIRELATALQAGLTIIQAMRTIARQGRSQSGKGGRQKEMLDFLMHEVEHGRSLADAAESWGAPFNTLTVNLIRAGEASGRLEEVLDQAATLLDRDVELRRALLGATLYPMILAGLIAVAVGVIVTVIVPKILEPLKLSTADLPFPTRVVQGTADFFAAYWWLALGALAAALYFGARTYAQPGPRLAVDRTLLRTPVLGRLLRDVAVARFTRTLGTLIGAGLPALTALRVTRLTLGNRALEETIEDVCDQVSAGRTIADPLEQSGYFPPLLVQIVGVGERSGRLPAMLRQAADAFEKRTEASMRLFTTVLPPALVLVMALVVGFVIAAVLLPLLEMQESIG